MYQGVRTFGSKYDWNSGKTIKVAGPLDLNATGILEQLLKVLAEAHISIFAISTYDTDYILVKADKATQAVAALKAKGCRFV